MTTPTLIDSLRQRTDRTPDRNFIKCGGEWLTFSALEQRSDRVASGLASLGVARGDRVVAICDNREEVIEALFACAKLGAIYVPFNSFLKGELLRAQFSDCGAKVLIADSAGLRAARPILERTEVQRIVALDADADAPDCVAFESLRRSEAAYTREPVRADDIAIIIYTSGTTGASKGCMLSHGYFGVAAPVYRDLDWLREGERIFTTLPLYHAAAINCVAIALHIDGCSIAIDRSFSASTFMRRAWEEGAGLTWGMGAMGESILARHAAFEGSQSVRVTTWFALKPESAAEIERRFNTTAVTNGFGQTECQGIALCRPGAQVPGTIGKPGPMLEVRIVDDDGNEVPRGQVGEIVARPRVPNALFSGYWNRPQATLEAWRGLWHHTGDLGIMRESDDLVFVDRKKDALRRRGENVSSFELEFVIAALPQVERVAICAVPAVLGEDDIMACIVLREGQTLAAEEFFAHCKANLPYFAIPRYVQFRSSLPLTEATGRVQKHKLRSEGVTESTIDLEALGLSVARQDRR